MPLPSAHPDMIALQEFADNETQETELSNHIANCHRCQKIVQDLHQEKKNMKTLFQHFPEMPNKTAEIMVAIRQGQQQDTSQKVPDFPWIAIIPLLITSLGMALFLYDMFSLPAWYERFGLFLTQLSTLFTISNLFLRIGQLSELFLAYHYPSLLQVSLVLFVLLILIFRLFVKRGYKHV